MLAGYYSGVLTAKRWVKKPNNQVAFEKVTVTIDDQGFIVNNARHEFSRISWQSVGNVYETKKFFLFEFTEHQISTLPKRVLTQAEQEELLDIIKRNFSKNVKKFDI
ncbi:YcxB family protein [Vagococcus zengguangii]|nr:YcxB family protein [Vagococcus zengguangii]